MPLGKAPFHSLVPRFPVDFAVALRDLCGLRSFIETGTYHGDTAFTVAPHFEQVATIEAVLQRYFTVAHRCDRPPNVECYHGDSGKDMGALIGKVAPPSLIFLDAHWIHAGNPIEDDAYQGDNAHCPVLAELSQIDMTGNDVILIDDVKFFDYPPRLRGDLDNWPSLDQIMAMISGHFVFVRYGMLCAVPEMHRRKVREWLLKNYKDPLERYQHEAHYGPS